MQSLTEIFEDESSEVRSKACSLVFGILIITASFNGDENPLGDAELEITNSIIRLLRDENKDVRVSAANSLIQLGQKAQEATGNLKTMLSDAYVPARFAAAVALAIIDPSATEAIPILQEGITIVPNWRQVYGGRPMPIIDYDSPRVYQLVAAQGLGFFGPEAIGALSDLMSLFNDSDFGELNQVDRTATQYAASQAIVSIDPTGEQAIPQLVELLRDTQPSVRKNSALTLGLYGPTAMSALAVLQELLEDPDQDVRSAAATAIQQIEISSHVGLVGN